MSNTRFTGGDWVATNYGYEKISINGVNGVEVCSCWNQANAHLIAAAPEMYDLLSTIENDNEQVPEWLWNKIQETLAKARGEQ